MTTQMWIVAGIAIFFMAIMLTGKVSLVMGSLTVLCLIIITKSLTISEAMAGYTQTAVLCIAAMLPMAGALGKTKLVVGIKNKIVSMSAQGGKDIVVAAMLFASAAILAQFMPGQTAIIAVLMTFLASLGTESEITMNRVLIPIVWILTLWLGRLPLANGATGFLNVNVQLEAAGLSQWALTITDLPKVCVIPCVICLIYAILTYKMLPKTPSIETKGGMFQASGKEDVLLPEAHQYMLYAAFVISVLALSFSGKIGEVAYGVPFACVMVLVALKVLDGRQCLTTIANGPVFAIGGLFALVTAITKSGLGQVIGSGIMAVMGENPSNLKILVVFAVASALLTSFINNTVCINVMYALAFATCATTGMDPRGIIAVIQIGSLSSVITPMSSNGCAIAYATAGLTVKDTWKWSIPGCIICVASVVINALLVYPPLGR